ncbi:MAG: ribonuclease III [Syntrophorhabdaceae bacterium]|nr:ribonuclease III [Syntrophorhabdaceae bacterium]
MLYLMRCVMFSTPIEEIIGYEFKNKELLEQAITHTSFFNERKEIRKSDNEKLEYLGDAILNCIISIFLYKKYKDRHEGFLSNARSCLVRRETLTDIAKKLDLGKYFNYGNGDNGVPEESKVLSNMIEALIGAVYLDGGIAKTKKVIKKLFDPYFTDEKLSEKSPKNMLQEYTQKKWGILPKYKFTRKIKNGFAVNVYLGNEYKAKGIGKTKKEAEQKAAKAMLDLLNVR